MYHEVKAVNVTSRDVTKYRPLQTNSSFKPVKVDHSSAQNSDSLSHASNTGLVCKRTKLDSCIPNTSACTSDSTKGYTNVPRQALYRYVVITVKACTKLCYASYNQPVTACTKLCYASYNQHATDALNCAMHLTTNLLQHALNCAETRLFTNLFKNNASLDHQTLTTSLQPSL